MKPRFCLAAAAAVLGFVSAGAAYAQAQTESFTSKRGGVVIRSVGTAEQAVLPNFVAAKPMGKRAPVRRNNFAQDMTLALNTPAVRSGPPGVVAGSDGDGGDAFSAVFLGVNRSLPGVDGPTEFGLANHPFSTARADMISGTSNAKDFATNRLAPLRAAGKLFFNIGNDSYVCSASLIKPGLVVTAAHCVIDFGSEQFFTNITFVPGYRNGVAPYGAWVADDIAVLGAYSGGTDDCSVTGIVCRSDVAVIKLAAKGKRYVGGTIGYYGYGWDGYGFNSGSPNFTQITQLGYPVCLDNGQLMQRNDSFGFRDVNDVDNTVIGSLMCGGSSGGPWLVNFGVRPALTATVNGTAPMPNVVVGVTSWGYTSPLVKQQGASRFTATNIVPLVNTFCPSTNTTALCQ